MQSEEARRIKWKTKKAENAPSTNKKRKKFYVTESQLQVDLIPKRTARRNFKSFYCRLDDQIVHVERDCLTQAKQVTIMSGITNGAQDPLQNNQRLTKDSRGNIKQGANKWSCRQVGTSK